MQNYNYCPTNTLADVTLVLTYVTYLTTILLQAGKTLHLYKHLQITLVKFK